MQVKGIFQYSRILVVCVTCSCILVASNCCCRDCGNIGRTIWKYVMFWSSVEWHYHLMYLVQECIMQLIAKELCYPFIQPSNDCVCVSPISILDLDYKFILGLFFMFPSTKPDARHLTVEGSDRSWEPSEMIEVCPAHHHCHWQWQGGEYGPQSHPALTPDWTRSNSH